MADRYLMRIDGAYQLLLPGNVIHSRQKWSEITSFAFGSPHISVGGEEASQKRDQLPLLLQGRRAPPP
jgi:hypothetical protein